MLKKTLSPSKREKLDKLVVKLNDLNAELKYLRSCQYLTMAEKIAKLVIIIRRWRLLNKLHKLIENAKENPPHTQEDLY